MHCHLSKSENIINHILEKFDINSNGFEYIEPILYYITVGRLGFETLNPIVDILIDYVNRTNQLNYAENMFVGLCVVYQIKPLHYLQYLTNRSAVELKVAGEQAGYYMQNSQ
eukprot:NODE_233_length_12044_cov_0.738803.p8 type:complete len:112 gc:universal NODE_233_length_12044_cov_0.738803:8109-7774(-)